jgi:hypothetical protein
MAIYRFFQVVSYGPVSAGTHDLSFSLAGIPHDEKMENQNKHGNHSHVGRKEMSNNTKSTICKMSQIKYMDLSRIVLQYCQNITGLHNIFVCNESNFRYLSN